MVKPDKVQAGTARLMTGQTPVFKASMVTATPKVIVARVTLTLWATTRLALHETAPLTASGHP